MSIVALDWAFKQPIAAKAGKSVLVALANFADDRGSCYPGQERLARMTGQSVRTVRRQLALLEAEGYIQRKARFDRNGHRTSDRYVLNLPATATSGESDQRSNTATPPANGVATTGHDDQVTVRENLKNEPSEETHSASGNSSSSVNDETNDQLDTDDLFDEFWAACRNKVDRKRTTAQWRRALKGGADPKKIISQMRRYTEATAGRPADKVKHPYTWLVGENWNDETMQATFPRGPLATGLGNDDRAWNDPGAQRF